jgi:transcription elongation factor SPT5
MIHQSFISKSFKDVRYTYTRWACATSAKTVIGLYTSRDPDEPQWWVEQAFIVTSSIFLMLDMFHRPGVDAEAEEYQACVQSAVRYLQMFTTSSVALHGVRLLLSLLQEYGKLHEGMRAQTCGPGAPTDVQVTQPVCSTHEYQDMGMASDEAAQFNFDIDMMGFEDLMEYLPSEGGFDSSVFFDSICELATGQVPL